MAKKNPQKVTHSLAIKIKLCQRVSEWQKIPRQMENNFHISIWMLIPVATFTVVETASELM